MRLGIVSGLKCFLLKKKNHQEILEIFFKPTELTLMQFLPSNDVLSSIRVLLLL